MLLFLYICLIDLKNYMKAKLILFVLVFANLFFLTQCKKDIKTNPSEIPNNPIIEAVFGNNINLNQLENYENQPIPNYIKKDNSNQLKIINAKATLGRILFYDKKLSLDNTVSCGSCHIQKFAFGDNAIASNGVFGATTARHSMRLVNVKFAAVNKFFWDKRATTLEIQTTMPIKDHAEMGYSGQNGRPDFNALITKLDNLTYYNEMFKFAYGDKIITEIRIQECLSQFIRSIQSFDSKYDVGRAQVNSDNIDFPNFNQLENLGKNLFNTIPLLDSKGARVSGGAGCNRCHNAPEFDIQPTSLNNGIIKRINSTSLDFSVTKSPTLRNLTNIYGQINSPMMHNGELRTIDDVLNHYGNYTPPQNIMNIDGRIFNNGNGTKLNLNNNEKEALKAFLNTLSGTNIYIDKKWSNPFK